MRAALSVAAFAAGVLAVPYNKRDFVTAYDVVFVTDVVTVTAGHAIPSEVSKVNHYGHGHPHSRPASHSTTVVEVTSVESTYTPPPPTSTPEPSTSSYVTPTSSAVASTSSVVTPSSSEAPTSSSAAAAAPTSYQEIVVYHHNLHRQNHSAPNVEWDDGLASTAAKIAASCVYAHNVEMDGGGYGQNIAAGVEANNVSAVITDLFYNGEEPLFAGLYGQANPDMSDFEGWGHFSQIVWKSTTKVACATQYCPNGLGNVGSGVSPYFTVCNYASPGNYEGEYGANVLQPQGHPTANWNSGLSSY